MTKKMKFDECDLEEKKKTSHVLERLINISIPINRDILFILEISSILF